MAINTAPLNTFRTVTYEITTTATNIYTTPVRFSSIVLGSQVSNVSNSEVSVTAWHVRGIIATELVKNFLIPPGDASGITVGRLVLEAGDSIRISASENDSLRLVLSILESSND